jgi:hypothetical protein
LLHLPLSAAKLNSVGRDSQRCRRDGSGRSVGPESGGGKATGRFNTSSGAFPPAATRTGQAALGLLMRATPSVWATSPQTIRHLPVCHLMLGVGDLPAVGFTAILIKKPRFEIRARLLRNRLLTGFPVFDGRRRASRGKSRRRGRCQRDSQHDQGRCRERYCDLFEHDHPPRACQAPLSHALNSASKTTQFVKPRPVVSFPARPMWQGLTASPLSAYASCQSDPHHKRHHFHRRRARSRVGKWPANCAIRAHSCALWRAPLAAIRSQLGKRPERPNNEIAGRRTNKAGNCGIPCRAVPI